MVARCLPDRAITFYCLFFELIALTILAVRLLARASFKDTTAQTAAGIHPIIVICKTRHRMPDKILPLKKNESHGISIAMIVMVKGFYEYIIIYKIGFRGISLLT